MSFQGLEWAEDILVTVDETLYLNDAKVLTLIAAGIKNAAPFQHWDGIAVIDPIIREVPNIVNFPSFLYGCQNAPELILAPIKLGARRGGHWTLLMIQTRAGLATYYDSIYSGDERVLPECEAKEYIENIYFPHLVANGYLTGNPVIMQASSVTYNCQFDNFNCGIHVARIAEEIILNGFSRRLDNFVIENERIRYFNCLRFMSQHRRLIDIWPEPLQQIQQINHNQQIVNLRNRSNVCF